MTSAGFFKKENNNILYAPDMIAGNGYLLLAAENDTYEYPVDGWIWANNLDEAMASFLALETPQDVGYLVQPEGFYLSTTKEDEVEFNKLITLVQLALNAGSITSDSLIKIKAQNNVVHEVTVTRFLEIMVGYGFFCYEKRGL
jgi:hypothetical protein